MNILEKQLTNENHLGLKQQIILESLIQHRYFHQLIENLLEQRLSLIDRMTEQMNNIGHFIKVIAESPKGTLPIKQMKESVNFDWNINNLIEKTKQIENEFCKR